MNSVNGISPCSHMAGVDLHHFLLKNCRWFQPRYFPHLITSVTSACWADPTASAHLLTNGLNAN